MIKELPEYFRMRTRTSQIAAQRRNDLCSRHMLPLQPSTYISYKTLKHSLTGPLQPLAAAEAQDLSLLITVAHPLIHSDWSVGLGDKSTQSVCLIQ